jgi:hypothetical protein
LIPDEALIEFPPGLAARSSICTGMLWAISWEAAERPARPEPTTIACFGVGVDMASLVVLDVRCLLSIEVIAMKRETDMRVKTLFFDIESCVWRLGASFIPVFTANGPRYTIFEKQAIYQVILGGASSLAERSRLACLTMKPF